MKPIIGDARSKIIQKQRSKISDARVILAKKERRPVRSVPLHAQIRPVGLLTRKNRMPPPRKRVIPVSDDEDEDELMDLDALIGHSKALRRTIKNNYVPPPAPMPPLPTFGRDRAISDPFDCYEPYERPAFIPQAPPPPTICLDDMYYAEKSPRKGILRTTSGKNSPQSPVSAALKSRLFGTPDPRQPSGLFARDRDPDKEEFPGYRIVVSNLGDSVTQSDIQELFEDIGELIDARLVRKGTAEVVYRRFQDAEMAVETYHNRQLDSQPMKCLLVRPRNSNKPTAPAARVSRPENLEIQMDTLHKVLFRR